MPGWLHIGNEQTALCPVDDKPGAFPKNLSNMVLYNFVSISTLSMIDKYLSRGKFQLISRFQIEDFRQNECSKRLFLQEIKKPLRASVQGQPSATYPQPKSDFINA